MTLFLQSTDVQSLNLRYATISQQLQPGVRRYNLFWAALENAVPPVPGGADPAPCPQGGLRVPVNESDRLARGYHNYHCYDIGTTTSMDDILTRDARIGAVSAVIAYGSPDWAIHPNCTGFPWNKAMFRLGCLPWSNLDDWEDYMNFMVERWSAPVGSGLPRVSSYVMWNEVQSQGWADPSPFLPNRYNGSDFTDAQMQVLVGLYAQMMLRADAAIRRHTRGVMQWISFDHFMEMPQGMKIGDVMHTGGWRYLDFLWPLLNQTISWAVAVHPYDNGDPRANLSSVGVFTFATLNEMVVQYQISKLITVANVPPQGCASQPQVMMYASEQGWAFDNTTMNDTLRARNICFAHDLSLQQGVWAVTHNYFQPSAGGQGQNGAIFGLVPPPPAVFGNLTNGHASQTYNAYVGTSPRQWGQAASFCCQEWGVGCST